MGKGWVREKSPSPQKECESAPGAAIIHIQLFTRPDGSADAVMIRGVDREMKSRQKQTNLLQWLMDYIHTEAELFRFILSHTILVKAEIPIEDGLVPERRATMASDTRSSQT